MNIITVSRQKLATIKDVMKRWDIIRKHEL